MATATLETSNPAFRADTFRQARAESYGTGAMTIQGAAVKSLVLVGILLAAAAFTWSQCRDGNVQAAYPYIIGGCIGGLIFAFVTIFNPRWSPVTAPLYAGCEGLALGGISAAYEYVYQGIVPDAVGLTIGTLVVMLVA